MNIAFAALIAAAILDLYTTHRGLKFRTVEERNPIIRAIFGPKPSIWPLAVIKAGAVAALVWLDVGTAGYLIGAGIWGAVSLHNLKVIRRMEDFNG